MRSEEISETEGEALAKRFRDAMAEAGITKRAEFVRRCGLKISASMINQHISGHRPISLSAAIAYAKAFNCQVRDISVRIAADAAQVAAIDDSSESNEQLKVAEPTSAYKLSTERDRQLERIMSLAEKMSDAGLHVLLYEAKKIAESFPVAKQTPRS